jgi:Uncharacterised nucleotidyltransferase
VTPAPIAGGHDPAPLADIEAEAGRLLELASVQGITIRLIGGVAVAQHRHVELPEGLERVYGDIDLVVKKRDDRRLREMLESSGYVANRRFNSLHGHQRLLYYDEVNGRQLDVFVGAFHMCHELQLDNRLDLDPRTLSPADLLLTKLQVVEVNWKDVVDALTLAHTHELGRESDGDVIAVDRLAQVTSRDWGWYTTLTDNLAKVVTAAEELSARPQLQKTMDRIREIDSSLNAERKSLGWKARAAIGRRVAWYDLPEEVGGGGRG